MRRTRRTLRIGLLLAAAAAFGCQGKDLCLLGYTTAPSFDPDIHSVYIPVFKNLAFVTNPHRGIEVDVTEAVVRELNARRCPIHVVSDQSRADTELVGTLIAVNKAVVNRNPQNLTREAELAVVAQVVWRDLRSGRVLTGARTPKPKTEAPFDPSLPPAAPPPPPVVAAPITITGVGRMLPELGESNTTAQQLAINDLARRIVNLMEQPWDLPQR